MVVCWWRREGLLREGWAKANVLRQKPGLGDQVEQRRQCGWDLVVAEWRVVGRSAVG